MENKSLESDTLSSEAAMTKAAIRRVLDETRGSLGSAVDVRLWTKKSPWIALGIAATAGMAFAVAVRRASNHAAANGDASPTPTSPPPPPSASAAPAGGGIGAAIASSLFDLAKFGVETAIMSRIKRSVPPNPQPADYQTEPVHAAD